MVIHVIDLAGMLISLIKLEYIFNLENYGLVAATVHSINQLFPIIALTAVILISVKIFKQRKKNLKNTMRILLLAGVIFGFFGSMLLANSTNFESGIDLETFEKFSEISNFSEQEKRASHYLIYQGPVLEGHLETSINTSQYSLGWKILSMGFILETLGIIIMIYKKY
jgi:hypothetical protein